MANLPTGFRTPKLRLPRRRVDTASFAEDDSDEDELEIRTVESGGRPKKNFGFDDIAEQDEELELEEETDAELENELIEEDEMEENLKTSSSKRQPIKERQESAKPPHFKVKNKRQEKDRAEAVATQRLMKPHERMTLTITNFLTSTCPQGDDVPQTPRTRGPA